MTREDIPAMRTQTQEWIDAAIKETRPFDAITKILSVVEGASFDQGHDPSGAAWTWTLEVREISRTAILQLMQQPQPPAGDAGEEQTA